MAVRILQGDCREVLATLPAESVHCCVTSPPYFGLRDYGHSGQIGLEPTPAEYVEQMVAVFREVRRVLRDDGTLWLNLGDSYAGSGKGGNPDHGKQATNAGSQSIGVLYGTGKTAREAAVTNITRKTFNGIKSKDLIGIPWRVAFALQADGWYLRQDIIWSKPNPMPESVRDRCTKAHEYVFLLSKSERYHCDMEAIAEPVTLSTIARLAQDVESQAGSDRVPGKTNGTMKAVRSKRDSFKRDDSKRAEVMPGQSVGTHRPDREESDYPLDTRNKRSVWNIATQPFSEAHFATMAPELAETCIKAGCPEGGTVLDPFGGAGTTGLVADRLQRDALLIELNPDYAAMAERRITGDAPLFAHAAVE
jgi:DNA modification methylase